MQSTETTACQYLSNTCSQDTCPILNDYQHQSTAGGRPHQDSLPSQRAGPLWVFGEWEIFSQRTLTMAEKSSCPRLAELRQTVVTVTQDKHKQHHFIDPDTKRAIDELLTMLRQQPSNGASGGR